MIRRLPLFLHKFRKCDGFVSKKVKKEKKPIDKGMCMGVKYKYYREKTVKFFYGGKSYALL